MSITQARAALPELIDRVLTGEEITITRHGRAVAVLTRPDALRSRRADRALADAELVRERLDGARSVPLAASPTLSAERAEEMIADVHRSRSSR